METEAANTTEAEISNDVSGSLTSEKMVETTENETSIVVNSSSELGPDPSADCDNSKEAEKETDNEKEESNCDKDEEDEFQVMDVDEGDCDGVITAEVIVKVNDDEDDEKSDKSDKNGDKAEKKGEDIAKTSKSDGNSEGDVVEVPMEDEFIHPLLQSSIIEAESEVIIPDEEGDKNAETKAAKSNNMFGHNFKAILEKLPTLTAEQEIIKRSMFNDVYQIKHGRVHCCACNKHLGNAISGEKNRRVHPLLSVVVCKDCYDFYNSGEFDQDEDGFELYCRCCGEGGVVICCTHCNRVFCKKCIRTNVGFKRFLAIKEKDDWMCIVCDPAQIVKRKINCIALYEYLIIAQTDSTINSHTDYTTCCDKKRANAGEDWFDPYKVAPPKKKKLFHKNGNANLNSGVSANKAAAVPTTSEEAEVICTPDVMMLMNEDDKEDEIPPQPEEVVEPPSPLIRVKKFANVFDLEPNQTIQANMAGLQPYVKQTIRNNWNNMQDNIANNFRPAAPVNGNRISLPSGILSNDQISNQLWFRNTVKKTAEINKTLTTALTQLSQEHKDSKKVEDCASVHNKMQEVLSQTINNLIHVRKQLRGEFLADFSKIGIQNVVLNTNTQPKPNIAVQQILNQLSGPPPLKQLSLPTGNTLFKQIPGCNTLVPITVAGKPNILYAVTSNNNISAAANQAVPSTSNFTTKSKTVAKVTSVKSAVKKQAACANTTNNSDCIVLEDSDVEIVADEAKYEKRREIAEIVSENLKITIDEDLNADVVKKMLDVRVVMPKLSQDTPKTKNFKNFTAFNFE